MLAVHFVDLWLSQILPSPMCHDCRLAKMVSTPVVGMVSQNLWSFKSESQCYLQPAEDLAVSPDNASKDPLVLPL